MNRHDINNVAYKVDGYIHGTDRVTEEQAFNLAKAELVTAMRRQVKLAEDITFEQFLMSKKNDFR